MEAALRVELAELINAGHEEEALARLKHMAGHEDPDCQFLAAIANHRLGEMQQAEQCYRRVLQINPDSVLSRKNLANLFFHQRTNLGEAITLYGEYLDRIPQDLSCLRPFYELLIEQNRLADAKDLIDGYLSIYPADADVLRLQVNLLLRQRNYLECLFAGTCFIPNDLCWDDVGVDLVGALIGLRATTMAEALAAKMVAQSNGNCSLAVYITLADIAVFQRDYPTAERIYRELIAAGTTEYSIFQNLGLLLLDEGRYEEGWAFFSRANACSSRQRLPDVPIWQGEDIQGRTILVNPEQGYGDVIQFLRYIPLLERCGAKVILNVYPDVLQLLANDPRARAAEGFCMDSLPKMDYQTFIMDLPLHLRLNSVANIPWNGPYLFANPSKTAFWKSRLERYGSRKVAIAWAGNPDHHNDAQRSASLADFAPLAILPGVVFISIQKGAAAKEIISPPSGMRVVDIGSEIADFADTAAILECVDLLISVDTSVAHLAGAMGKPVWILLPTSDVDWRWRLDQDKSPWYPSVRLFRQEKQADWKGLLQTKVRPALANLYLPDSASPEDRFILEQLSAFPRILDWTRDASVLDADSMDCAMFLQACILEEYPIEALESYCSRLNQSLAPWGRCAFGEVLTKGGKHEQAIDIFKHAATGSAVMPSRGYQFWAMSLHALGLYQQAFDVCRQAADLYPDDAVIKFVLGMASQSLGNRDAARAAYRGTVDTRSRHWEAWLNLARLAEFGDHEASLKSYQRVLQLRPEPWDVWLSIARYTVGKNAPGLGDLLMSHLPESFDSVLVKLVKGQVKALLGNHAGGQAAADECIPALAEREDYIAGNHLAAILDRSDLKEAVCRRFVAKFPADQSASFALGTALLAEGNYTEGWLHYCAGIGMFSHPDTAIPEWRGEALGGQRLLVCQDQGSGDLLQFACLLRHLPADCRVTLAVHGNGTVELLVGQQLGCSVMNIDSVSWDVEHFDFYIAAMKLPLLVWPDLSRRPNDYPYLKVPRQLPPKLLHQLEDCTGLRVGIIWAGNPRYSNDAWRSTRLVDWNSFAQLEGVDLISLQKDMASSQALGMPQLNLHNVVADCESFLETAQVISHLDLVVSVDSALAHLAGALDVSVWVLLPHVGMDWRWGREREDCPWYPSMRFYRQGLAEPWSELLKRVARAIAVEFPDKVLIREVPFEE